MPNFLFPLAAAAGLTAFFLRNYTPEDDEADQIAGMVGSNSSATSPSEDGSETPSPDQIQLSDVTDNSPVSINLAMVLLKWLMSRQVDHL